MTRSAFMRLLLVVASILIIIGVILLCGMLRPIRTGDVINIYLEDGVTEEIGFKRLALVPGDSERYHIRLEGDPDTQFKVKASFIEKGENTLKDYVFVKIVANGALICDKLLAEAFEDDLLIIPADFRDGRYTDIVVTYYLPLDVGNEAKNAEAIFTLQFTPSKK